MRISVQIANGPLAFSITKVRCGNNSHNAQNGTQGPVITFRFGRIKATIWENEVDQKKFYNVTFARTYVDRDKKLRDTDNFGRDDLPLVAKLADEAHSFIFARLAEQKAEAGE